jgi:hypothetical protein
VFKSPGLWGDDDVTIATPSNTPVEFEEGFAQGMALLQAYPIDELGRLERVIDIAIGVGKHEDKEGSLPAILLQLPSATAAGGLGSRLGDSIWRGFTNQNATEAPPSPAAAST